MAHALGLRQRIAVVSVALRTREHARRAIRALGHSPMVFTSFDELLAAGPSTHPYALMCIGLPAGVPNLRRLVDDSKEVVGRDVPIMFMAPEAKAATTKGLGRIQKNEVLTNASSFAELYNALEAFMVRHGIPLAEPGLVWSPYRFFPACALVQAAGADVWLEPLQFELALEFFHNVDRPLSSEWLRYMVATPAIASWPQWLDESLARLRSRLQLGSSREWTLVSERGKGHRLNRLVDKRSRAAGAGSAIERCLQH